MGVEEGNEDGVGVDWGGRREFGFRQCGMDSGNRKKEEGKQDGDAIDLRTHGAQRKGKAESVKSCVGVCG